MSGNVGYAPMHRSLELFLAWKSLIFLCARDWTLREFWMGNCTWVMQLLLVHLKEMQELKEELASVSWYLHRGLGLGLLHMHQLLCASMHSLEIPARLS